MIPFEPRTPVEGANLPHEDKAPSATRRPSSTNWTDTVTQEPAYQRRSYKRGRGEAVQAAAFGIPCTTPR